MDEHRVVDLTAVAWPAQRAATEDRPALREALNAYVAARLAHRGARESLASAEAVLAARVHLVHVLTDSGWQPPPSIAAQLALDEALLHEPSREERARV